MRKTQHESELRALDYKIALHHSNNTTQVNSRNIRRNGGKNTMMTLNPSIDNDYQPKMKQLEYRRNTIKGNRTSGLQNKRGSADADKMWEVSPFVKHSDEYNHKSRQELAHIKNDIINLHARNNS